MTPESQTNGSSKRSLPVGILITFVATATLFIMAVATWKAGPNGLGPDDVEPMPTDVMAQGLARSGTVEDFRAWIREADERADAYSGGFGGGIAVRTMAFDSAAPEMAMDGDAAVSSGNEKVGAGGATRVSGTNVQTVGIDEPDVLKTDGERLFFSPQTYWGWPRFFEGEEPMPVDVMMDDAMTEDAKMMEAETSASAPVRKASPSADAGDEVMMDSSFAPGEPYPGYVMPTTKVIDAFPVEDLAMTEGIKRSGELLLSGDTLMVFAYDGLYAYDVSESPAVETWSYQYNDGNELVTARLRGDEVFLVMRAALNRSVPCPLRPFAGTRELTIACGDIWHPAAPVASDVTYTVMSVDAESGDKVAATSFTGSWSSTATYMSTDDIYLTWQVPTDTFGIMALFVRETGVFPESMKAEVARLDGYDISDRAKLTELQVIMEEWMSGMDRDQALLVQTELQNRADAFVEAHQREFQRTGIVRIAADGLTVEADGTIPGSLLNQFSLDAYDGHLRVATTVGGRGAFGWQFGFGGADQSVNDVYVLDGALQETGSVLDLGRGERIYSARFIGDEGYVVTFKQIDPFYVLDLSDPTAPRMTGELKIPGYSSYLHPLAEDLILGVGQEEWRTKLSLFDVSNPAYPTEVAKYMLDEGWNEVLTTHHAFLQDAEHGVFFLPGGKGGYIFAYEDGDLELVKAVSGIAARRAVYLDDYLYLVGDDAVVVLDETTWERVGELELGEE